MFSWSRPASTPSTAASSSGKRRCSSGIGRDVHLSSYLNHPVLKPSTRKVSVDDTIYDTVFQTTNGFALIIRVYLPQAPTVPSFTLHGVRATHDWVDTSMKVIGYSPISSNTSWKNSGLKLGDAVYAVIHHFQLNPPMVREINDVNLRRLQENLGNTQSHSAPPAYSQKGNNGEVVRDQRLIHSARENTVRPSQHQESDDEVNLLVPSIPSSFPQLNSMTMSELKELLDNETLFESFIRKISEVATLDELKESIISANVDIAQTNLAHRESVEQQSAELDSLQDSLQYKLSIYKKIDEDRVALSRPPDVSGTLRDLNHAKKKAYRDSEAIAENWVESSEDIAAFVKAFMDERVLYHTRSAKLERLSMST